MTTPELHDGLGNEFRNLRVLLVCHELNPGAPSIPLFALEHVSSLDVLTIAPRDGTLRARYEKIGKLEVIPPWSRQFAGRVRRKLALLGARRSIRQFQPDVVYVNSIATLESIAELHLPDVPMVLHVHELDSYIVPIAASHRSVLIERPVTWIAPAQCVAAALARVGVPRDRIQIIPEFVPDGVLASARVPATDAPSRPPLLVVGGAGHLSWRKGVSLWLQTAAALRASAPSLAFEFRWIGVHAGDELNEATNTARALGISDVVSFIPKTPDAITHFREFDAFVMSSLEDPCPIVVFENMALEKPVLCFRGGGGAPEQLGDTGIVVDDFSPALMAAAILELASDPSRMNTLGALARTRVAREFVASVQAPRIVNELRRAAGWSV